MTEIIVQYFVENLLKLLKLLKTRTALKRKPFSGLPENGDQPSSAYAPHGRALKRLSNQEITQANLHNYAGLILLNFTVLTKQRSLHKIKAGDQYWLSAFYI